MADLDPSSTNLSRSSSLVTAATDSMSPNQSQNSNSVAPIFVNITAESFFVLERGPRYRAYADLRESKLRKRNMKPQEEEEDQPLFQESRFHLTPPPKKQVKFHQDTNTPPPTERRRAAAAKAAVAQSMPDFSAVLRKENRKPAVANVQRLPPVIDRTMRMTMTPPAKRFSPPTRTERSGGSKSASAAAEKRRVGVRRSYAGGAAEELKGLASAVQAAITGGDNSRGRSTTTTATRGAVRNILGHRIGSFRA